VTLWCIGRNYAAHARELGNDVPDEPVIFLKASSCLRGLAPEPLAVPDEAVHHEVELVLVVGHDVPIGADPGWAAVSEVAVGLDLTRRQVQSQLKERGLPWARAKSFGGSAVVGPRVPRADLGDPEQAGIALWVNGALRQEGRLDQMLFDVPSLLRHLAALAPLHAGDLVFTGTPPGVAEMRVGDRFRLQLRGAVVHTWEGEL
jgi:2-keto-4-pentenoate hydratase/2-oxohepta-3-ene-1,7-dioic acid hydratase in catechol pathway